MADARTRQLQEPSTRLILASHTEPVTDIKLERQRATFDVEQLSYVINGGKEQLDKRWGNAVSTCAGDRLSDPIAIAAVHGALPHLTTPTSQVSWNVLA